MVKLTLVAKPTFKASVPVPVAGGDPVLVEMEFRHRTKTDVQEFIKSCEGKADEDSFLEMVTAWELEEDLTKENVAILLQNYMGAGLATFKVYLDELFKAKVKN